MNEFLSTGILRIRNIDVIFKNLNPICYIFSIKSCNYLVGCLLPFHFFRMTIDCFLNLLRPSYESNNTYLSIEGRNLRTIFLQSSL